MLIHKKPLISIPILCPKCNNKLHHVNALDTEAKIYMVFCLNYKCRYCVEYEKDVNGDIFICL